MIIKALKKKNIAVSKGTISKIKNNKENCADNRDKSRKRTGRPRSISRANLMRIENAITKDNPPTFTALATKYKVSRYTISRCVKKYLCFQRKMKKRVHFLTQKAIETRHKRSRKLAIFLEKNWDKVITTDEKLFHMCEANIDSPYFYRKKGSREQRIIRRVNRNFSKGVMVWGGVSAKGLTKLLFIKPGIKINANYYINDVLKPLIADSERLYPGKQFILQQDSAPSHRAKKTIDWLKNNRIKFINPSEWIPNSPDAAPMDYCIWGYMLSKLKHRKVGSLNSLKRALRDIWANIPQEMVIKCLKSWPKRVNQIYKAKGANIENFI